MKSQRTNEVVWLLFWVALLLFIVGLLTAEIWLLICSTVGIVLALILDIRND
jgi:hypothetical protein